jgi:PAS domain S-box-containing protein
VAPTRPSEDAPRPKPARGAAERRPVARFAAVAQALTGSDRMAELLPLLHQHAVEAAGGSCSILFQFDPGGKRLRATSAFGVDALPLDPWPADPADARVPDIALGEKQPLVLADVGSSAPHLAGCLGTPAAVIVPLLRLQERMGVLAIGCAPPTPDEDVLREVASIGHAFVLALERARSDRDANLQRDLRVLLQDVSRTVSSSLKLAAGLEIFCIGANRLFAADRTSVWLHERRAHDVVLGASSDTAYLAAGGRASTEDALAPAAVALRRSRAEIGPMRGPDARPSATVMVTVPLKGRRRALGAMILEGVRIDPGAELDLLTRADEVGRQLSGAIENVLLLEDVLRSHRELEHTFNSLVDFVAVCDRRGHVVHVNQAFLDRLGEPRTRVRDRPLAELVGPEARQLLAQTLERPDPLGMMARDVEDPVLKGTFSITLSSLRGDDEEPLGLVMVARDITPRARLEAERMELRNRLSQSEKLAALGQLVAGIAHELNNPLQGVLGHLELLRTTAAVPKDVRRDLLSIYREADRAAKIIRNLLVFAGSHRLARRRMSLNALLARVLALRSPARRASGIQLIRRHDERLPRVQGDPLLLQQALLNIIINAEQAIDAVGGGRIETQTLFSSSRQAVLATIRDTGPGIPAEVLPHVFEPFYTTKEVGQGTGLGLAIAYRIIQDHGGQIIAANHPDGGAVFTVELPAEQA